MCHTYNTFLYNIQPILVLFYAHVRTYRPVVIQVTHLVAQSLVVIWFEASCVPNDIVVSRGHSSLSHRLTYKEEVKPEMNIIFYISIVQEGFTVLLRLQNISQKKKAASN